MKYRKRIYYTETDKPFGGVNRSEPSSARLAGAANPSADGRNLSIVKPADNSRTVDDQKWTR
jgi:hypothetical protein